LNSVCRRVGCSLLLALSLASHGHAQSFVFASANTRAQISDDAARASQNSFEQQNFLAVARYLAARLCHAPRVEASQGLDGPGAENSAMVTGCKSEPAAYLGELLGRYAHQKWILVFIPAASGRERMFVITLRGGDSEQVARQMRQRGLSEGTILEQEGRVITYIWVKDRSLDVGVHAFAEAGHGEIREIAGEGMLIGDDDRAQAQRTFTKKIFAYERAHKVRLSVQLWSRRLHDMGLDAPSR